ncbi:MAG: YdcF family protein [Acidimicrobiia bacterium]|nr:YdcF family protein [Acidimicrobiia bacterium]
MPTLLRLRGTAGRALSVALVLAVAGLFFGMGPLLVRNDPLQQADAVHVLAGSRMDRPLEGAMLLKEGYAGILVLTREKPDAAERLLASRYGIAYMSSADRARDILQRIVPAESIIVPPGLHDNTAQEATTITRLAREHGWKRVIVVTSVYHTRRAGYALRRALGDVDVEILVRATRYDDARPWSWWLHRADMKYVASEAPKFLAYLLGLAD